MNISVRFRPVGRRQLLGRRRRRSRRTTRSQPVRRGCARRPLGSKPAIDATGSGERYLRADGVRSELRVAVRLDAARDVHELGAGRADRRRRHCSQGRSRGRLRRDRRLGSKLWQSSSSRLALISARRRKEGDGQPARRGFSFPLDPVKIVAKDVPLGRRGRRPRDPSSSPSIRRGFRYPKVDMLKLTANGVSSPPSINVKNLPLQAGRPAPELPADPAALREPDARRLTNQTAPRGSYYTLTVTVG